MRNLPDIELSRSGERYKRGTEESPDERRVEGFRNWFDEHKGIFFWDEAIERSHINRIDFRGSMTNN